MGIPRRAMVCRHCDRRGRGGQRGGIHHGVWKTRRWIPNGRTTKEAWRRYSAGGDEASAAPLGGFACRRGGAFGELFRQEPLFDDLPPIAVWCWRLFRWHSACWAWARSCVQYNRLFHGAGVSTSALSQLNLGIVCHWLRQCWSGTCAAIIALAEPVAPQFLAVTKH
jgi:hypothetical protein